MKTKQILSCFCLQAFLLLVCSCKTKAQQFETVTTAVNGEAVVTVQSDSAIVPHEYVETIEQADSITWYIVDPFAEKSDGVKWLEKIGEVLTSKTEKHPESIGALKATLTYPESFEASVMVKECTFLPDIAIEFSHGADTVFVAYSFYCDICRFYKFDAYKDFDGELIREAVLQLASEVFPNDKYLRNLNRKKEK